MARHRYDNSDADVTAPTSRIAFSGQRPFPNIFARCPLSGSVLLAVLTLLAAAPVQGQSASAPPDTTHYRVDAEIDPASGRFDVTVDVHFVPSRPADTLRFLLHEDLEIQDLSSPAMEEYATSPWQMGGRDSLFTRVITIPLIRTATPQSPVSLSWTYAGQIPNDHFPPFGGPAVTPHWVELPVEAMWVPVHASLRQRFTFDARVRLPEGYDIVSVGTVRKGSGAWHVESTVPGPDVPLLISDRMQSVRHTDGPVPVTVYHAGAPDSIRQFVAGRAAGIVDRYARRFQSGRDTDDLQITLAPVERASSSSYARPGLIALRHEITPDTTLHELLAHEAAHLWWTDSADPMSRHNFLNESFAEYEAWRVLEDTYGPAAFERAVREARKEAKGAPSFFDWSPKQDRALSYNKGPLLLHRLQQRIGEDRYLAFVRRLQREDVGTLEEMIATLRAVTSDETAQWFEELL